MRCPKCGYTSFDNLEVCRKCHKKIAGITNEITGTAFHCAPPAFLQATAPLAPLRQREQVPGAQTPEQDGPADEIREEIETDFSLDNISMDETSMAGSDMGSAGQEREITMDMDGLDEIAPRDEFTLDLDADRDKGEIAMPALDFGDLDISDLAPPVGEMERQQEQERPAPPSAKKSPAVATASISLEEAKAPSGLSSPLEDLQFSGLNLDTPPKLAVAGPAGKKHLPSVKTGTALDNFEIDLGELFAESAETKK